MSRTINTDALLLLMKPIVDSLEKGDCDQAKRMLLALIEILKQ